MISHGARFVLRHRSGRYLRTEIYSPGFKAGERPHPASWRFALVANPFDATAIWQEDHGRRFLADWEWQGVADQFEIVGSPCCQCCGYSDGTMWGDGENHRCDKHRDRNPCAIEGCKRTAPTPESGYLGSDSYLCGEHWRRFVPPRSRKRRLYHAYFRKAKRYGWNKSLIAQFHRFWDRLIADARRKATEGDLDVAEIHRMMGWDGPELGS